MLFLLLWKWCKNWEHYSKHSTACLKMNYFVSHYKKSWLFAGNGTIEYLVVMKTYNLTENVVTEHIWKQGWRSLSWYIQCRRHFHNILLNFHLLKSAALKSADESWMKTYCCVQITMWTKWEGIQGLLLFFLIKNSFLY